jgi:hypothetical protein
MDNKLWAIKEEFMNVSATKSKTIVWIHHYSEFRRNITLHLSPLNVTATCEIRIVSLPIIIISLCDELSCNLSSTQISFGFRKSYTELRKPFHMMRKCWIVQKNIFQADALEKDQLTKKFSSYRWLISKDDKLVLQSECLYH